MKGLFDKLRTIYEDHLLASISRSWCLQDRGETKHRLQTVIALSVELEAIKKVSIFSTAFGEQVIEEVIQGDWRSVEEIVGYLTFKQEDPLLAERYEPLWERFRAIALTACAEAKRRVPGTRVESH